MSPPRQIELRRTRLSTLACPKCRGPAHVERVEYCRYVPRCMHCNHRLGWFPTQAEATAAWNRLARPVLICQGRR